METFAKTQKRKCEEKEKTKRKRRSGGELVYLKEKF
jgi:hypothetical protein